MKTLFEERRCQKMHENHLNFNVFNVEVEDTSDTSSLLTFFSRFQLPLIMISSFPFSAPFCRLSKVEVLMTSLIYTKCRRTFQAAPFHQATCLFACVENQFLSVKDELYRSCFSRMVKKNRSRNISTLWIENIKTS